MRVMMAGLAATLLLAACASSGGASSNRDGRKLSAPLVPPAKALELLPKSALAAQTLSPGECGLFLWSQTDVSKFIFYSEALSGKALLSGVTEPLALNQTGAGGDIFGQFNTHTTYDNDAGYIVLMELEPGEELEGGQRVKSGLITAYDKEGWVTKLPVLGVWACQPDI